MKHKSCSGFKRDNVAEFLNIGDIPLTCSFLPNIEAINNEKVFPLPLMFGMPSASFR